MPDCVWWAGLLVVVRVGTVALLWLSFVLLLLMLFASIAVANFDETGFILYLAENCALFFSPGNVCGIW